MLSSVSSASTSVDAIARQPEAAGQIMKEAYGGIASVEWNSSNYFGALINYFLYSKFEDGSWEIIIQDFREESIGETFKAVLKSLFGITTESKVETVTE